MLLMTCSVSHIECSMMSVTYCHSSRSSVTAEVAMSTKEIHARLIRNISSIMDGIISSNLIKVIV